MTLSPSLRARPLMRAAVGMTRRLVRGRRLCGRGRRHDGLLRQRLAFRRRQARLRAAQLRPGHDQGHHGDDGRRLRDVGPPDAGVERAVDGIVVHVRYRPSAVEIRPPVMVGPPCRSPWPLLSSSAAVALPYDLTLLLDTNADD